MRSVLVLLAVCACGKPSRNSLDLDLVRITGQGKMRTDTIGDTVQETATFVLVDAQNTGKDGAYITLAGDLVDADKKPVGDFKPTSLYIPAGEIRTFALVDRERKPRPTALGAKIVVRSATIPEKTPPASVDQVKEIEDNGKLVVQGVLHKTAERKGQIVVIGSFHGEDGRPMTRPFAIVTVPPHTDQPVQFVSQPCAKHGTIYVGEVSY
ncbi:MAG TPA: hypothetical protein VGC41_24350 [Kofleriaceae bacterium]